MLPKTHIYRPKIYGLGILKVDEPDSGLEIRTLGEPEPESGLGIRTLGEPEPESGLEI